MKAGVSNSVLSTLLDQMGEMLKTSQQDKGAMATMSSTKTTFLPEIVGKFNGVELHAKAKN